MNRLAILLLVCLPSWAACASAWGNGYTFCQPLTVASSQITGTVTDFTAVACFGGCTNSLSNTKQLATVANGGNLTDNTNGFDFIITSDQAGSSALKYCAVTHNLTTGVSNIYIKATLAVATEIYLFTGKSGVTTDQSDCANSCDSHTVSYYPLKDGSTLSGVAMCGSNAATLTKVNTPTATTGQIDGAGSFVSASSQTMCEGGDIACTPNASSCAAAMTMTAWVNPTSFPNAYNAVMGRDDAIDQNFCVFLVKSTGKLALYLKGSGVIDYDGTGSHTLSTGTWQHLALTYDSTSGLIGYVNASSDGTAAANGTLTLVANTFQIGSQENFGNRYFNGPIDEVRFDDTARSSAWITAEYNDTNNNSAFWTLGTQVTQSGGVQRHH